jgi:hypothetical protein
VERDLSPPPRSESPDRRNTIQDDEEDSGPTYTHERPMSGKIQLNDDDQSIVNNPDYWHKKKRGIKKLRNQEGVDVGMGWRAVNMRAYRLYRPERDGDSWLFDNAQMIIPWFDPNADSMTTESGLEPEASDWEEDDLASLGRGNCNTSQCTVGDREDEDGEKYEEGDEEEGDGSSEYQISEDGNEAPYKSQSVISSDSEDEDEGPTDRKNRRPKPVVILSDDEDELSDVPEDLSDNESDQDFEDVPGTNTTEPAQPPPPEIKGVTLDLGKDPIAEAMKPPSPEIWERPYEDRPDIYEMGVRDSM